MKKLLLIILVLVECVLAQGCGGAGSTPAIAVSVTPAVQTLDQGANIQFSATVFNASNTGVTWSVQGAGTITPQGLYTAPASAGNATIVATSVADSSKRASATVTIREVSVVVAPAQAGEMDQGATLQFTATVAGTVNKAVTWGVQGAPASGVITAEGLYTAPTAAGTFQVVATSVADTSKSGSSSVNVREVLVLVDYPSAEFGDEATVCRDEDLQFEALVFGTVNQAVTWSVAESGGGGITQDGLYTAPAFPGVFTVVATSVSNPGRQGAASVFVNEIISVQITPAELAVVKGRTQQFTARAVACREGLDESVTWSLEEGAGAGSITDGGLYTAPASAGGPFHLVASSVADPSQTASSTVTVVERGFVRTGDTQVRRAGHTATRLADGKVLIAGGGLCTDEEIDAAIPGCDVDPATTAELFDPATGEFTLTGQMSSARSAHAAVLLDNGKVLLIGDLSSGTAAELYDPVTGEFTPTGSMTIPRFGGHTANLLLDGTVLVAGGFDENDSALNSAEIYDPATGMFSPAGSMTSQRAAHGSVVLADGRTLLVGGVDSAFGCGFSNWLASSELYSPSTKLFAVADGMQRFRSSHSVTVLDDGSVLVVGGFGCEDGAFQFWEDAEIFSTGSLTFEKLLSMKAPRRRHSATLLPDGTVLIVGGTRGPGFGGTDLSSAELFDPVSEVFSITGDLEMARAGHRATLLLDGRVLITGGAGDRTAETFE